MGADKLGQMAMTADNYATGTGGTYQDQVKQKIISLVHDNYPWLGDFDFELVEQEPGESFAYGAASLKGFADGFSVEFPVVYSNGEIMEIPAFLLTDRNLKLPFTEKFYNLIVNSLNNTDNFGKIREREDLPDSSEMILNGTDYKPVADILKLSSLTRVLAKLPRRVVRSYAKKACAVFPELTRDFYSAIALSKLTSNVKKASAQRLSDKIASKGATEGYGSSNRLKSLQDANKMVSIASPVFLSEAEYKEKGGVVEGTSVIKVLDKIFVMPEANSKVSVTSIPSFEEITKSLSTNFELMSPADVVSKMEYRASVAPSQPIVLSSPSTLQDYWMIPSVKVETESRGYGHGTSDSYDNSKEYDRILKANSFGGELLAFVESPDIDLSSVSKYADSGKRVCYFPEKIELSRYLLKKLNSPLSIYEHDIQKIICKTDYLPVKNGEGHVLALPLRAARLWDDVTTKETTSKGEVHISFYEKKESGDTLAVKVTADKESGIVSKIYYVKDYMPYDLSREGDLIVIDMADVHTFDPNVYSISEIDSGVLLTPLKNDESGEIRPVNIYVHKRIGSKNKLPRYELNELIRDLFSPENLDPDFILNTLGCENKDEPDFAIPYINIQLRRNKDVILSVPNRNALPGGPTVVNFTYPETEDMISALGHIGILPDDLKEMSAEVKTASASATLEGTKLSYAMTPAMPEQQGTPPPELSSEEILQQAIVILQDLKANQDAMREDASAREAYTDKQLAMIEAKLEDVEELKTMLSSGGPQEPQATAPVEQDPTQIDQAPTQEEVPTEQTATPEAVARLAEAINDPAVAEELGLTEEDMPVLQAAATGDPEAAKEVGLTPQDQLLFIQMVNESSGEEGTGQGMSPEDIQMAASVLSDPASAEQQGIDPQMIQTLTAAAEGDQEAMGQLGITPDDMDLIISQAQGGGEGDPGTEGAPGEEGVPEEDPEETFNQAMTMVQAYLDPSTMDDNGVTAEDLGYVTLIVKSPDKALMQGIPGSMVQAVSDAYHAITGKSAYQSAEAEFGSAPDMSGSPTNINAAKNVISNSKGFEEYSKPLAETSALLDLIPKVKTAKLFFKNADAFRDMLSLMGDILINLQLNAIQYKDSMGPDAYDRILAKTKKTYDSFGNMILDMYSLDKSDS